MSDPRQPKSILVVAAHPDDEVLGCGGTIARHAAEDDSVTVVILGEGVTSRAANRGEALNDLEPQLKALKHQVEQAHRILGVKRTIQCNLPDNRFDHVDLLDIIKHVETACEEQRPQIVYTHHPGDLNIDHRLTCEAVLTACRPLPGNSVRRILAFEVLSSTEWAPPIPGRAFMPNFFLNIGEHLDAKLEAMRCYRSELRDFPHPRSIEALEHQARLWGAKSGFGAAEAFQLIRERA